MIPFLVAWVILSLPASIIIGSAIVRRSRVVDVRATDLTIGSVTEVAPGSETWVGMSQGRWPT